MILRARHISLRQLGNLSSRRYYSRPSSMSSSSSTPLLVTPQRLASLMREAGHKVRILDATWFMPNISRNAHQEFLDGPRIPSSTFWNVDAVASLKEDVDEQGQSFNPLGLSHMMPSSEKFAKAAGKTLLFWSLFIPAKIKRYSLCDTASQGISNDTLVVVSDSHGIFSSPRTAFTFYAFGHDRISILDGGLPGWLAEGLPVENGELSIHKPEPTDYKAMPLRSGMIRSYDEMVGNARMASRGQTVLDARPNAR